MNIKTSLKIDINHPSKWVEVCRKGFFYLCSESTTMIKDGDSWKTVPSVKRHRMNSLKDCILSIEEPILKESISLKIYLRNLQSMVKRYEQYCQN